MNMDGINQKKLKFLKQFIQKIQMILLILQVYIGHLRE